ncbi:MAG: flagellar protein FlgN [Gammaproteobacteria bacterium]|nr:flagellar protein FlgN [Gammaproteobacteria bacterium]
MTFDKCNEALRENIDESIQNALELRRLLQEEREALERKDTLSLSDTAIQKRRCCNRLEELDKARTDISKSSGFGVNPGEIAKLAARCDDSALLTQSWDRFLQVAHECSDMNSGNGAIIRVRQKQIKGAINLLRDGSTDTDTYGPNGESREESRTRPLAQA